MSFGRQYITPRPIGAISSQEEWPLAVRFLPVTNPAGDGPEISQTQEASASMDNDPKLKFLDWMPAHLAAFFCAHFMRDMFSGSADAEASGDGAVQISIRLGFPPSGEKLLMSTSTAQR